MRRIAAGVTVLAVHEPSAHNDEKEPDYKTKRHKDLHTLDVAPTPFCISLQHSVCPLREGRTTESVWCFLKVSSLPPSSQRTGSPCWRRIWIALYFLKVAYVGCWM